MKSILRFAQEASGVGGKTGWEPGEYQQAATQYKRLGLNRHFKNEKGHM